MRVYTSKLTPDNVVTYLFHDCERSHSVIVPSILVWRVRTLVCDDQSTVYTLNCLCLWRVAVHARVCALFEGLTVLLRISTWFCATMVDFSSRIERLHVCYYSV